MQHKVKLTVLDKKLYSDLQAQYCSDPKAGACPVYNIGDEFIFERYDDQDHFWHMGLNTLKQSVKASHEVAGGNTFPHCSEAWDAISRYIYTGLQGGSIMRGWMNDERVMITCCSDGTRPVIFKVQRLDFLAIYIDNYEDIDHDELDNMLKSIDHVDNVIFKERFIEVYVDQDIDHDELKEVIEAHGYNIIRID